MDPSESTVPVSLKGLLGVIFAGLGEGARRIWVLQGKVKGLGDSRAEDLENRRQGQDRQARLEEKVDRILDHLLKGRSE